MKFVLDIIRENPRQFFIDLLGMTAGFVCFIGVYILLYALGF